MASGAWSGTKATSGSQSTGTLSASSTYTLSCSGTGGTTARSVTVTVAPAPTLTFTANPMTITSGESTTLTWSSTQATSCSASGAWSGTKAVSGSEAIGPLLATSTFTLSCTGSGGTSVRSVAVTVSSGAARGLDFPGSAAVSGTMRFRFLNPLAIYPATYIWRAYPRRQAGYYTAFFWGNDDGLGDLRTFLWKNGGADSYYGAHPYPSPPPNGTSHNWEISIEQQDFQNGVVVYDRWYTQALLVWADSSGNKHHEFYWDLPNTDAAHRVTRTSNPGWGNTPPPVPALTWGDAPWAPGKEVWNGILRGIHIYSTNLSMQEILSEAATPLSTTSGATHIWYLNIDPTPDDISDKSGRGHHPQWVGPLRPGLWSE